MKITAFAASTSRHSINKQLVDHTLTHFGEFDSTLLDLNDFEMPLFSVDREHTDGHPEAAHRFLAHMADADLLVISMAEHNGNYTAAFKNTLDWCSRVENDVFKNKPVFLMSTSPGGYGAKNSLNAAIIRFPKHTAHILETFSLPLFNDHFDPKEGITDEALKAELLEKIASVKTQLAAL